VLERTLLNFIQLP